MAIEPKRGCGYRKVDGLYLEGVYIPVPCDRLPVELGACPVCGSGIHFTRAMIEINPLKLWGYHQPCGDHFRPCKVCDPPDELAYIMMVGSKFYSPESFLEEANRLGISKRLPFIPKKLIVGKTIVYLAHPQAVEVREPVALQQALAIVESQESSQNRLLEAEQKPKKKMGIFCAFIPHRIVQIVKESDATEERKAELAKRGITLVIVPDNDADHQK